METNEVGFVSNVITDLTGDPLCFDIDRSVDERGVLLLVHLDDLQFGRVIGKAGSTVNALRELLRALGLKNQAKYSLKVEKR